MNNKKIYGYTSEQLLAMDPEVLAAIIRGKGHMNVQYPLYQAISLGRKLSVNFVQPLRELLGIWEKRKLPCNREDIQWGYQILRLSDQYSAEGKLQVSTSPVHFSETDQQTVIRLIESRRSVRGWLEAPVPVELVEKVLEAGLWAPHSCNLQTIRYLLLEWEEEIRDLAQARKLPGNHVAILVAQDMRPYRYFERTIPEENQNLECGAAVQNMLLCAHALGLGAVWLTFEKGEVEKLQEEYRLPEYIALKTYICLGWPSQDPLPPGRKSVQDAILPKETEKTIITSKGE